ncbi:hypothetical protein J31TS6_49750 [Brevibacillus reuszeri]|nr:hypothetical protein J31TS6_49750 [Brevibacillus reuszeri]
MTTFRFRPYVSIIGICLFIFTIFINNVFELTTDSGTEIILSTFSPLLLMFTLLWGLMGVIELITLIIKTSRLKTDFKSGLIISEDYQKGSNSLKLCYLINVCYLVLISFQFDYVLSNWDKLNV